MQRIDPKTMYRLKRLIQGVILMSVMIVIMKVDWKLRGPEAIRHENKVISELDQLRPPPSAVLMSKRSSVNPGVGILDRSYEVQGVSPTGIEHWYKEEFGRLNWKPLSVESHQSKRQLRFCRNGETAILILPVDGVGAKTEFQIDIGLGSPFAC